MDLNAVGYKVFGFEIKRQLDKLAHGFGFNSGWLKVCSFELSGINGLSDLISVGCMCLGIEFSKQMGALIPVALASNSVGYFLFGFKFKKTTYRHYI